MACLFVVIMRLAVYTCFSIFLACRCLFGARECTLSSAMFVFFSLKDLRLLGTVLPCFWRNKGTGLFSFPSTILVPFCYGLPLPFSLACLSEAKLPWLSILGRHLCGFTCRSFFRQALFISNTARTVGLLIQLPFEGAIERFRPRCSVQMLRWSTVVKWLK